MISAPDSKALAAALLALTIAAASPAWAGEVSAADKAAAEALFEHGKALMKDGRYAEACAKLQESQRIDPGIGTRLYLADCFEKNGQTASAWAEFLDAAAAARAANQPEREKKARDRALALEPKLNKMSITVAPGADVPGLDVRRDGSPVTKPLWGTVVPVDPGEHTIEAVAPGKKRWVTKVKLDPAIAAPVTVQIPALEALPPSPEPLKPEPPKQPDVPRPQVAPPPVKAEPIKPGPIVTTRETMPPVRIAGGTFVGVGLASAAVGGILGMVTLLKKSSLGGTCHDNGVCSAPGRDSLNSMRTLATPTTVLLATGGGLFVTGLVMLLATRPADRIVARATPVIGVGPGGVSLGGSF